jgi:hypothetical protein
MPSQSHDKSFQDDEFVDLIRPEVDPQDINQEMELQRLEKLARGQEPHIRRDLITAKLSYSRELLHDGNLYVDAEQLGDDGSTPPFEVVDQLVAWSIEQSAAIQEQMFRFFEQPEVEFENTLKLLHKKKLLSKPTRVITQERESLAALIERTLENAAREGKRIVKADLYEMARASHISRRPEAAVRQSLRRYISSGWLTEEPDGQLNYHRDTFNSRHKGKLSHA